MIDPKILLGVAAVYFLAVLIFPVLRGKQPLLPWLICTASQLGAIYYFPDCTRLLKGFLNVHPVIFGFKLQTTDTDLLFFTIVFCLLINLLLIVSLNSIVMGCQIIKDNKKRAKRLKIRAEKEAALLQKKASAPEQEQELKAAAERMKSDLKRRGFDYISNSKSTERG